MFLRESKVMAYTEADYAFFLSVCALFFASFRFAGRLCDRCNQRSGGTFSFSSPCGKFEAGQTPAPAEARELPQLEPMKSDPLIDVGAVLGALARLNSRMDSMELSTPRDNSV